MTEPSAWAELRRKAAAATPGPWAVELLDGQAVEDSTGTTVVYTRTNNPSEDIGNTKIGKLGAERNAAFIASVSPDVVLRLLDERDALARQVEDLMPRVTSDGSEPLISDEPTQLTPGDIIRLSADVLLKRLEKAEADLAQLDAAARKFQHRIVELEGALKEAEQARDEAVRQIPTARPVGERLMLNAYGRACYDAGRESAEAERDRIEAKYRANLWLGHGHVGLYGDDGEMQCSMCVSEGAGFYDYKREPLERIEKWLYELRVKALAAGAAPTTEKE